MSKPIEVWISLSGVDRRVGTLFVTRAGKREHATFTYDDGWRKDPHGFSIDPLFGLDAIPQHTGVNRPLLGAIADSCPDRWGRVLMHRREVELAKQEGRATRTLGEKEVLLAVNDLTRVGALRFKQDGIFLAPHSQNSIPPIARLRELSDRARNVDDDDSLRILFEPGSSLGGARPKASILETDGSLSIAKFEKRDDEWSVVRWEAVTMELARMAGLRVAKSRVLKAGSHDVFITNRFDRKGQERVPFISAMSMVGAADSEQRSYLEIVEAILQHGSKPNEDCLELWKRVIFSILVSNLDDHLRNHAFLWEPHGWRLSPAYDLNPVPRDVKEPFLSTAIDLDDATASLDLALSMAEAFRVSMMKGRQIIKEMTKVVDAWPNVAGKMKIPKGEFKRMESAFNQ